MPGLRRSPPWPRGAELERRRPEPLPERVRWPVAASAGSPTRTTCGTTCTTDWAAPLARVPVFGGQGHDQRPQLEPGLHAPRLRVGPARL